MSDVQLNQAQLLSRLSVAEKRAADALTLVPSENRLSAFARLPFVLDAYNRYFFNTTLDEEEWLFPGGIDYGVLETDVTLPLAREMLDAPFVNVRPLSGLSAMVLALSALGGEGGARILHLHENIGGHYATGNVISRLGLNPIAVSGSTPLDLDLLCRTINTEHPQLLYVDQANAIIPIGVEGIVQAARAAKPDILIHVDISHWMGLVIGRQMRNPLDLGADSIGGSTHKSFPGPQKGLIATRREDLAQRFADAQYYLISSHHLAASISLGLALWEFREHQGTQYATQVVENARQLGAALYERGFYVHGRGAGFTNTHQLWVQAEPLGVPTTVAAARLRRDGIRANYLPSLPGLPAPTLRLGLSEITRLGIGPRHIDPLADLMLGSVRSTRKRTGAVKSLVSQCTPKYAAAFTSRDLSSFLARFEKVRDSNSTLDTRSGGRSQMARPPH